jgi:uncharacterized membrane protein
MEFIFIIMLLAIFLEQRKLQSLVPSLFNGSLLGVVAATFIYIIKKYVVRLEIMDVVEKGLVFLFIILCLIWVFSQFRLQIDKYGKYLLFLFSFIYALEQFEIVLLTTVPQLSMANGMNSEWIEKMGYSILVIILFLLMALGMKYLGPKLNNRFVFILLIFQILILFLNELTELLQTLFGLQIIPLTMWALDILAPIVNHKDYFFYILTIAIISFLFVIFLSIYRHFNFVDSNNVNPAERRKFSAQSLRIRRWFYCLTAIQIIFFSFLASVQISQAKEVTADPPIEVTAKGGYIHVSHEMVQGKKLNVFSYRFPDHTEVRFLVAGKTNQNYSVALDACSICGVAGYYQKGDQIICKKCNSVINVNTIGFTGGCNPIPMVYENKGNGELVIPVSELAKSKSLFQ